MPIDRNRIRSAVSEQENPTNSSEQDKKINEEALRGRILIHEILGYESLEDMFTRALQLRVIKTRKNDAIFLLRKIFEDKSTAANPKLRAAMYLFQIAKEDKNVRGMEKFGKWLAVNLPDCLTDDDWQELLTVLKHENPQECMRISELHQSHIKKAAVARADVNAQQPIGQNMKKRRER